MRQRVEHSRWRVPITIGNLSLAGCSEWNRGAVENCRQLNGSMLANGTCVIATDLIPENSSASYDAAYLSNRIMPSMEYFQ